MILLLEIGLAIFGLVALITGKLTLSKTAVVRGAWARLLGGVALAPWPVGFSLGLFAGTWIVRNNPHANIQSYIGLFVALDIGLILTSLAIVYGVGFRIARSQADHKKPFDDDPNSPEPLDVEPAISRANPPTNDAIQEGPVAIAPVRPPNEPPPLPAWARVRRRQEAVPAPRTKVWVWVLLAAFGGSIATAAVGVGTFAYLRPVAAVRPLEPPQPVADEKKVAAIPVPAKKEFDEIIRIAEGTDTLRIEGVIRPQEIHRVDDQHSAACRFFRVQLQADWKWIIEVTGPDIQAHVHLKLHHTPRAKGAWDEKNRSASLTYLPRDTEIFEIFVESIDGRASPFTLTIRRPSRPPEDTIVALPAAAVYTHNGEIERHSKQKIGNLDRMGHGYQVDLLANRFYCIELLGTSKDNWRNNPQLYLLDQAGTIVAQGRPRPDGKSMILYRPTRPERFRVFASHLTGVTTGSYQIWIEKLLTTDPALAEPEQQRAEISGTLNAIGEYSAAAALDTGGKYNLADRPTVCKVFSIDLTAGREFKIAVEWKQVNRSEMLAVAEVDREGVVQSRSINKFLTLRPTFSGTHRFYVFTDPGVKETEFTLRIESKSVQARPAIVVETFYTDTAHLARMGVPFRIDGRDMRSKEYAVEMTDGQNYLVELESNAFLPTLFIVDSAGTVVARDFRRKAQIHFVPSRQDRYLIYATSFEGNHTGEMTLTIRNFKDKSPDLPKQPTARQLPAPAKVEGVEIRSLTAEKTTSRLCEGMVWADDGASVYVLARDGLLMRLSTSDGKVLAQHNLASECFNLTDSAEGLLVSLPGAEELWVIDPAKLNNVKKQIAVPGIGRVGAGRMSTQTVVTAAKATKLQLIDLRTGKIQHRLDKVPCQHFAVSPDGKFAFTQSDAKQMIVRHRIEAERLVTVSEQNPYFLAATQRLKITRDSQYIAIPAQFGYRIYPLDSLDRPLSTVQSLAYHKAIDLDPISGYIFTHSSTKSFLLFTYGGTQISEHTSPDFRGNEVQEISVSPRGFEAVLRTEHQVFSVKLRKSPS